ncbi:MAPEG family protein [Pseudoxanthomonas daejeonensis]|uniref:MAPEG family protein n=1 Tax=Pseudoxanthomonas daejeonensis TaxID=266062 RepID=UPI001F54840C|nr:MAPEG family protein [Pseudoxanthomonas daejeonensis]UNK56957.1 MAPEG family protein [Pseudoxanthomonas daejeonensis]
MAPTPRITLLVASLHVLFYLFLSMRVILHRKAHRIGVGTGGNEAMTRRVRVHANFAEYVPLALLMLALLELSGTAAGVLWACGLVLLLARVAHAIGLGGSAGYSAGRFGGTILTFAVLLAMALLGVWRFLAQAML